MKSKIKAGVLIALLSAALGARAEVPGDYQMVLLTDNFPPFNMAVGDKNFARDDAIDGIAVDIVREMFKRAGIKYSLSLRFPWERLYNLTRDKANYGLFCTTYTEERKNDFKWVGPLAKTEWTLVAPPGSSLKLDSLEDARKYRIGSFKNNALSVFLQKQGFAPVNSQQDADNIEKLMKGQIDLWATDDPSGRYIAKQKGVSDLTIVLRFNEAQMYLALNKETPDEVVQKLQGALDQLRKEGFLEQAARNYL